MSQSISVITKKRGRPVTTGKGTLVGTRFLSEQLKDLDTWASAQTDQPSRPEAIRRLVELGIAASKAGWMPEESEGEDGTSLKRNAILAPNTQDEK